MNTFYSRIIATCILVFAKLGLRSRFLHVLLYGSDARNLCLARGAYILCDQLTVQGMVQVGAHSKIIGQAVTLGKAIRIDQRVTIRAKRIALGNQVIIESDNQFEGMQLQTSALELGNEVWIFQQCYLNTSAGLYIGDGTGVGGFSMIWTHGSWQSYVEGYSVSHAPTYIGKNVWIPWQVIILPGVKIGDNATIWGGSVISTDIPDNSLAVGTPGAPLKVFKSGTAEWPRTLDANESLKRLRTIMDEFSAWVGGEFDSKRLTIFGNTKKSIRLMSQSQDQYSFESGAGEIFQILLSSKASPMGKVDLHEKNSIRLWVALDTEIPTEAANWINLKTKTISTEQSHVLFDRLVSFMTFYGVRLRDAKTGLLCFFG